MTDETRLIERLEAMAAELRDENDNGLRYKPVAADLFRQAAQALRERDEGDPTEGLPGMLMGIVADCANGRPINGGNLEKITIAAYALRERGVGAEAEAVKAALDYAADIRWQELAEGADFTLIDRIMVRELRSRATHAIALTDADNRGGGRP